MNYKKQLIEIITHDSKLIAILQAVEKLNVKDAWVCAGLIRNKVWDVLHETSTSTNDIDVIYYDPSNTSLEKEKQLESELESILPNQPWSVKNQARMHLKSGFDSFTSSYDGVAHFPETPTAIAIRLRNEELEIMAPYGLQDLFELRVKPTPSFQKNSKYYSVYLERMKKKKWDAIWEGLSIEY